MLVALDEETLFGDAGERKHYPSHQGHLHQIAPGGGVVYDADLKIPAERFERTDIRLHPVPYMEVLEQALTGIGRGGQGRKYVVMRNIVALGASIGLIGYDEELVIEVIRESFKGRKAEAAEMNAAALTAAAAYARSHFPAPAASRAACSAAADQRRAGRWHRQDQSRAWSADLLPDQPRHR
jgi:hypothetical protein